MGKGKAISSKRSGIFIATLDGYSNWWRGCSRKAVSRIISDMWVRAPLHPPIISINKCGFPWRRSMKRRAGLADYKKMVYLGMPASINEIPLQIKELLIHQSNVEGWVLSLVCLGCLGIAVLFMFRFHFFWLWKHVCPFASFGFSYKFALKFLCVKQKQYSKHLQPESIF